MAACMNGNTTVVSMMLDFMNLSDSPQVDPYIDHLGCTPLFITCSNNQLEVLKLLLNHTDFIEMLNVPNVVSESVLSCDLYRVVGIVLW